MGKNFLALNLKRIFLLSTLLYTFLFSPAPSYSADVLILGNTKLKPISDVLNGIDKTLKYSKTVKSLKDVNGNLKDLVDKEGAKAVIALGKDSVSVAQTLPDTIPIIYGLIINPIETVRGNITGVYLTTPVNEYLTFLDSNFPDIKKVGIVCTREAEKLITPAKSPEVIICNARNPYEFIEGLNSIGSEVDALLLLPERDLITSKVLEKLYLYSFKEKKPVIGISEKYVKIGSLFSLGFDTTSMGIQIGEMTNKVLLHGSTAGVPQAGAGRATAAMLEKK